MFVFVALCSSQTNPKKMLCPLNYAWSFLVIKYLAMRNVGVSYNMYMAT